MEYGFPVIPPWRAPRRAATKRKGGNGGRYSTRPYVRRKIYYGRSKRNYRTGGFLGIENKFLDTELTAVNLTAAWVSLNPTGTGCTDSISVPSQGDGESDRDGRKYTIDSIMVRGHFRIAASLEDQAVPQGDIACRVIVYWDTQTNSTEATATEIMDAGETIDVLAFRNLQHSKRFRVLFDKMIIMRFNNATTSGAVNTFNVPNRRYRFNFYKKFAKGVNVTCDATTANVSSCSDNNFGIAAVCDNVIGVPQIEYQTRIRFRG